MDRSSVDTRWWNLGFGMVATAAMAACGPTITLDDDTGESITDGETDSETTPTTVPPGGCANSTDCEPGFECIDNQCVPYYDYCGTAGCCYGECCYGECYYYECYGDSECGPGSLCESFQECFVVDPIVDCNDPPELTSLPLVVGAEDEIVSLSFVDAEGDPTEDLVVGGASGEVTLYRNIGNGGDVTLLPFPADGPVIDVVSADFTGDGLPDLAGASQLGTISVLAGDGLGGFTPVAEAPVVGPVQQLSALDWNGDGAPDLAILGGDALAVVYVGDGAGDFAQVVPLVTDNSAYDMVTDRFGSDAFDDVAVHTAERGVVFWGNAVDDTQPDGDLAHNGHGQRWLTAADYDGGGIADIAGHTRIESFEGTWTLVEGWRDGYGEVLRTALFNSVQIARSDGDVDGDGLPDAVTIGGATLNILRGNPEGGDAPLFSCADWVPLEISATLLAVGDVDGDGRAELAVGNSNTVLLLR